MKNKELKTLKDLEHKSENAYPFIDQFKIILKQEAIKDIKIIKEAGEFNEDLEFLSKVNGDEAMAIISYIMHKHNLEHEDLKEEKKNE